MIAGYESAAYGVGDLKPTEFWAMTPAEFTPYIRAKIKHREEEIRMDNGRIGLICAIIQNGVPVGYVKKGAKTHKPGDYFRDMPEKPHEGTKTQRIFDAMNAWCAATAGGSHG